MIKQRIYQSYMNDATTKDHRVTFDPIGKFENLSLKLCLRLLNLASVLSGLFPVLLNSFLQVEFSSRMLEL